MSEQIAELATVEEELPELTCYIVGDEDNPGIATGASVLRSIFDKVTMKGYSNDRIVQESSDLADIQKSIAGSAQESTLSRERMALPLNQLKVVEPPFPPELLKLFSRTDETNFRCIAAKAQDAVGRPWSLEAEKSNNLTPDIYDKEDLSDPERLKKVAAEILEASTFFKNCNSLFKLEGVLLKAALDLESIGWAAIEVIRSADLKVHSIDYAPADRFKVLEGWKGFVEGTESGTKTYYQPFGHKVVSKKRIDPNTLKPYPYSAELDGELTLNNAQFSLIDSKTGEPTSSFQNSANEIIWIVKHHPSTLYYGMSETVPILPKILINMNINQYSLQFFEHNTVPRYAVIIKGAKLSEEVKNAILTYFQTEVKGRAHKTMILPLPTGKGEVSVEFKKLDADSQDGWFRESYKDNADSIRISHGVTAAVVGQSESASLGSGKGMSQAEIYKDRVAIPNQDRWASELVNLLRLGRGLTLVQVKFAELDTRDHETKMREFTGYLDRGVVSINQVRAACSLGGPIKGGNRPFIKVGNSLVFIDELEDMKSTLPPVPKGQAGGDTRANIPPANAPENNAVTTVQRGPN